MNLPGIHSAATTPLGATRPEFLLPDRCTLFELIDDEPGGVEGVVVDSLGMLRQGVRVGVVGSNQEVYTNTSGRYSITGLNPGRYQVRFVDPELEAYGFLAEPVARDVIRGQMTALDY
ncbi:MAG: carboxypeptidase-like regulatory domain-containing protein, partial [Acidimicrobiia bacterium]